MKPISPSEVAELKQKVFPDFVIEAFNNCIARKFKGRTATIMQNEVLAEIIKLCPHEIDNHYIFKNSWLDVEDVYRKNGWKVTYDSPGYCESYEPSFEFTVNN